MLPLQVLILISIPSLHLPCFFLFPVDKEAQRKKITDELYKGFEQDRAKAEQELQAWLEHTQAHIHPYSYTSTHSRNCKTLKFSYRMRQYYLFMMWNQASADISHCPPYSLWFHSGWCWIEVLHLCQYLFTLSLGMRFHMWTLSFFH